MDRCLGLSHSIQKNLILDIDLQRLGLGSTPEHIVRLLNLAELEI